jgi:hypothetical protein
MSEDSQDKKGNTELEKVRPPRRESVQMRAVKPTSASSSPPPSSALTDSIKEMKAAIDAIFEEAHETIKK